MDGSLPISTNYFLTKENELLNSINKITERLSILKADELIREVLEKTGLVRSVSSLDREFYKTWTQNWGFSHEQIVLVSESAKGKASPLSYLNKVLSSLNSEGVHDTAKIKTRLKNFAGGTSSQKPRDNFEQRAYTKEEMSAVFTSLDDVEI